MEDIMKIIESLEECALLIKSVGETIKNKAKVQKGEFLITLLGTLAAGVLKNLLAGKPKIPRQ